MFFVILPGKILCRGIYFSRTWEPEYNAILTCGCPGRRQLCKCYRKIGPSCTFLFVVRKGQTQCLAQYCFPKAFLRYSWRKKSGNSNSELFFLHVVHAPCTYTWCGSPPIFLSLQDSSSLDFSLVRDSIFNRAPWPYPHLRSFASNNLACRRRVATQIIASFSFGFFTTPNYNCFEYGLFVPSSVCSKDSLQSSGSFQEQKVPSAQR